jgi:hypothetical protein
MTKNLVTTRGFKRRVIDTRPQMLIAGARHSVLSKATHVTLLSPSWRTLADVVRTRDWLFKQVSPAARRLVFAAGGTRSLD